MATASKEFMKNINKRLGEGSIFSLDDENRVPITPIPTCIPSLDLALGIGGLPIGRMVEIYGPESGGKTTLSLYITKSFQILSQIKNHILYGKKVVFIDVEQSLDPVHAESIGVDTSADGLLIAQPDSAENAYDLIHALINSGEVGLIIVDSLAAMTPQKEIENSASDQTIGLAARINSSQMRKMLNPMKSNNCTVIFLNQIREKVGLMFGNPETTPGGRALKFNASIRMQVSRKMIEASKNKIGQTITVQVIKNKVARPFTKTDFDYFWDTGVDLIKDIMNTAIDMDIVKKSGAWYFLGESTKEALTDEAGNKFLWQGKQALEETLKASPEFYNYLHSVVMAQFSIDTKMVEEEANDVIPEEEE